MPRYAREKSENGIYHVMLRGINRQIIFYDDEDCEKYLQCLMDCRTISGFELYAYCLMGNHIHLLMKEVKEPLELIFKRIGARYVSWYNWKYMRSGHLFQDRYKSEPIKDEGRFIAVIRYIYQNPVKAKICERPEEYRWSSCRDLRLDNSLVDTDRLNEIVKIEQLWKSINEATDESFIDLEPVTRLTDREAIELMKELSGVENMNQFLSLQPEKQDKFIEMLHKSGCSIRQLARVTGITKARIERMLS